MHRQIYAEIKKGKEERERMKPKDGEYVISRQKYYDGYYRYIYTQS